MRLVLIANILLPRPCGTFSTASAVWWPACYPWCRGCQHLQIMWGSLRRHKSIKALSEVKSEVLDGDLMSEERSQMFDSGTSRSEVAKHRDCPRSPQQTAAFRRPKIPFPSLSSLLHRNFLPAVLRAGSIAVHNSRRHERYPTHYDAGWHCLQSASSARGSSAGPMSMVGLAHSGAFRTD
ncbi:hypothetical protein BDV96DRAFT_84427 [Lophiotrema nucula]|uniref:Uncharacterized protein n=1 Tax=Lophiotrema nucula TaxID=690887 RepID=A0A6A5Z8P0_9PLEO|nr:hypothetical protein BDV96DRAFT_84427 [Lophiotrema nucula]